MNVLINAGPTRESIDPVRFISNRSTGKMGYAIAEAALKLGHAVTLVSGPVSLPVPDGLAAFIPIESAAEMACAAPALHGPVLFTRSGCPNCKTSKLMLDKAGVRYSVIDAEQDAESTRRYGVKKAPSLLVPDGDGFQMYDNASEIRRYIESIG